MQFKPVMVQSKANLGAIGADPGQYIVVIDSGELYLDKEDGNGAVTRVKVSQNVYIQPETPAPANAKAGDIWFVTEE